MSVSRPGAALAAAALGAVAVMGLQAPANAQTYPPGASPSPSPTAASPSPTAASPSPTTSQAPASSSPSPSSATQSPTSSPTQGTTSPSNSAQPASVTDSTPRPGQQIGVSSGAGSFDAGTPFTYTFSCGDGQTRAQGSGTVGSNGSADFNFTIPEGTPEGTCTIAISGSLNGAANEVDIQVDVQGDDTGGTNNPGTEDRGAFGLPRTGSAEILPLTAAGLGLVLGGAALAVTARRRRDSVDPAGIA